MPRSSVHRRATARRPNHYRHDGVSTALLLPDLHPWLKEFFAMQNLMPIRDEDWNALPKWEAIPDPPEDQSTNLHEIAEAPKSIGAPFPAGARATSHATSRRHTAAMPVVPASTRTADEDLDALDRIFRAIVLESEQRAPALPPSPRASIAVALPAAAPATHPSQPAPEQRDRVRYSSAPVPFTIALQHTSPATPSRHFLHIHRSPRALPAPNLLSEIQSYVIPLRASARTFGPKFIERVRTRRAATTSPAPMVRLIPPYDELLITHVILQPILALWANILWPMWTFLALSTLIQPGRRYSLAAYTRIRTLLNRVAPTPTLASIPFPVSARVPWRSHVRHAMAFAVILAVVILPIKLVGIRPQLHTARGQVLSATASAVDIIRTGGAAFAHASFRDAAHAFDDARRTLEDIPSTAGWAGRFGARVSGALPDRIGGSWTRAERLRRSGIALANASSTTARGLDVLQSVDLTAPNAPALLEAGAAAFGSARMMAASTRTDIRTLAPTLLPPIDRAITELERAEALIPTLGALAGVDRPRRILLVFQNPAELRPTGGFIGSIALLDVRHGRIASLELPGGGSYDISGVSRVRVLPPEPLRLLSSTWQFHDANWFPDFPTSARKLRWFYDASGGPSVDAVIAVNASVLADILTLTGPVTLHDRSFTASDVIAALTDTVEDPRNRASGKPKAIVADLAPLIFRRLLALVEPQNAHGRLAVIDRFVRALDERDILISFTDDRVQQMIVAAGWAGDLRAAPRDALAVVHANLGGGKTDARMREDIAHHTEIMEDGSAIDTVTITRTHDGGNTASPTPSEQLALFANVDYLRVYVPRGSQLLQSEGFTPPPAIAFEAIPSDAIPDRDLLATELSVDDDRAAGMRVTEEFGRTAFGGWVQIPPGAKRTVRIVYRLPWTYDATTARTVGGTRAADPQPYSLLVQKQSGTRPTIRHSIALHPRWTSTWAADNLRHTDSQTWSMEDILTTDRFTGMMIAPR